MAAESETNSLTMKLLALANYCEGTKAQEIKNVIAQLPTAAYKERTAADNEVARLRQENAHLKQRLALEVLANRQPPPPTRPPPRSWSSRDEGRPVSSASSSMTMARAPRHTPPRSRALFPDRKPPVKRPREETPPPPPPPNRLRPMCTGCFQIGGMCDGKSECSVCQARGYGCEYNECWDGRRCIEKDCTRLHPEQWTRDEEPKRVVKLRGRQA